MLRAKALPCIDESSYNTSGRSIYFDGLNEQQSVFKQTMYLAEDRVMGCEITGSEAERWTIDYSPHSVAITDPCDSWAELLQQRRRWICSTMACKMWVAGGIIKQLFSDQNRAENSIPLIKSLSSVYLLITIVFQWLLAPMIILGYVSLFHSNREFLATSEKLELFYSIGGAVVFMLIILQCLVYMARKANWLLNSVTATSIVAQTLFLIVSMVLTVWRAETNLPWITILAMGLIYSICLFYAARQFCIKSSIHIAKYIFQYTSIVIPVQLSLNLYAVLNMDDLSWGTKGKTMKAATAECNKKCISSTLLLKLFYTVSGALFVWLVGAMGLSDGLKPMMLLFLMAAVNILLVFKFFLGIQ